VRVSHLPLLIKRFIHSVICRRIGQKCFSKEAFLCIGARSIRAIYHTRTYKHTLCNKAILKTCFTDAKHMRLIRVSLWTRPMRGGCECMKIYSRLPFLHTMATQLASHKSNWRHALLIDTVNCEFNTTSFTLVTL
jgi:hypothetical protein